MQTFIYICSHIKSIKDNTTFKRRDTLGNINKKRRIQSMQWLSNDILNESKERNPSTGFRKKKRNNSQSSGSISVRAVAPSRPWDNRTAQRGKICSQKPWPWRKALHVWLAGRGRADNDEEDKDDEEARLVLSFRTGIPFFFLRRRRCLSSAMMEVESGAANGR